MSNFAWQLKLRRKKLKLFFSNVLNKLVMCTFPTRKIPFDSSTIKTILIARNDKIGDMVITTPLIKNLTRAGYEVYVTSQQGSLDIIKHNPWVKGTFSYNDNSIKELYSCIRKIRKQHFDLVIDARPFYSFEMRKIIFCAFTKSTHLIGFNKSNIKSYNVSIPYYDNNHHISHQLNMIYKYLKIHQYDPIYDLHVAEENEAYVSDFIHNNHITELVVVNPFGGAKKRELSTWQMEYIVSLLKEKKPKSKIVFIGEPNKLDTIDSHLGLKFRSKTILDVVSLIKKASFVVTVDTSIVHITTAFNLSCLTIYSESILHEETDDFNLKMRKKWKEYYRSKCNYLVDKPYLKKTDLVVELPYCYDQLWCPNNSNAKQIVFYKSFLSKVKNNEFITLISRNLE